MNDRIQFKLNGTYITLPQLMRIKGRIVLEYKPEANQIQVKCVDDSFNGLLRIGKSIGALKHDFTGEEK